MMISDSAPQLSPRSSVGIEGNQLHDHRQLCHERPATFVISAYFITATSHLRRSRMVVIPRQCHRGRITLARDRSEDHC